MATGLQNIHSHTAYCDGKLTPEEMVIAALEKGCDSFGLSGHSHASFDSKHSMSSDNTLKYISEINELKEKYAGRIELFLGVEQEYYSETEPEGYDFILGAVHYIKKDDELVCIDNGPERQRHAADTYFGGDYYSISEAYFETVADIINKTNADIVAHFDLVAKYNINGSVFDEMHPRYIAAALGAMERILDNCKLFELNTGAMYRLNKPEPYPSVFLLKELRKRGGEIILSSDSHDAESICHKFDEMEELLRTCGYTHTKRLTKDGFVDIKL